MMIAGMVLLFCGWKTCHSFSHLGLGSKPALAGKTSHLHLRASRSSFPSQSPSQTSAPRPNFGPFGGHHREGFFTALVAALATWAMSLLQNFIHKPLWVPPFGAIVLMFAAEAVAAAKGGKILCRKSMWSRALRACSGVAGACLFTVGISEILGSSPTILRVTAMFFAAFSMTVNPSAGYFPPAGAFCALYVEKAVSQGLRPGIEFALFPCALGVALLLLFTRLITFMMAHPLWKFKKMLRARRQQQALEA